MNQTSHQTVLQFEHMCRDRRDCRQTCHEVFVVSSTKGVEFEPLLSTSAFVLPQQSTAGSTAKQSRTCQDMSARTRDFQVLRQT